MKRLLLLLTLLFVGYASTTFAAATQDNETSQLSKTKQEFIELATDVVVAELLTGSVGYYVGSLAKIFRLCWSIPSINNPREALIIDEAMLYLSDKETSAISTPVVSDGVLIFFKKLYAKKLLSSLNALEDFIKGLNPEQRREVVNLLNSSKEFPIYKMIYGEKKVDSTTKKTRILQTVIDVGIMAIWAILVFRKLCVFKDKCMIAKYDFVNRFIRLSNPDAEGTRYWQGKHLNDYSDILDNEVAWRSKLIFLALFVDAAIIFAKNFYFTSDEDEKKAILDRIKNMLDEAEVQKGGVGITS